MEGHSFSGTFLGLKIHLMMYFDTVKDEKRIKQNGDNKYLEILRQVYFSLSAGTGKLRKFTGKFLIRDF